MNKPKEVEMLFDYWREKTGHERSRLDDKRRRRLATALRLFSLAECKAAVDGCARSPWHMGENPRRKKYDQISLIFRDAEKIEMFIEYSTKLPGVGDRYRDEVDDIIESTRRGRWN